LVKIISPHPWFPFMGMEYTIVYSKLYSRDHRFSENWTIYLSVSGFIFVFLVFECESALPKHPCQQLRPVNGQARLLLVRGVTMAKITCFQPYVLVNGNETMTCVGGKWDSEFPICASKSCIYLLIIINALFTTINHVEPYIQGLS